MSIDRKALEKKIKAAISVEESKISELKELTQPIAPENAIGRVSRMDSINNKSVNEAALRNAEAKLSKLKIALEKINDAGFGLCARCGNPIQEGRIILMPHSNKCIHCADK